MTAGPELVHVEVAGGVTAARGFRVGTAACGIKAFTAGAGALPSGQRDDLAVIVSDAVCDTGGVFTTNRVKAAPIAIDQLHLRLNRIRAIVVNSGNANACTGAQGFRDALQMAKLTADRLDLDPQQVLVSSTGVIGRHLPMDAVKQGIAQACASLSDSAGDLAARAIMTTDTVPKAYAIEFDLAGARVRVGGIAKGSGMIHPNMATLLTYVTTDAAVEPGFCQAVIRRVADRSFNQVTVDGDTSTNDTFILMANGAAGNPPVAPGTPAGDLLETAILQVARELARMIARDGEGATRLITIRVGGAVSDEEARQAARTVATSLLVKTAVHGGDPNWGRILCALGYSGAELALDRVQLSISGIPIFARGSGLEVDLGAVRKAFERPEVLIEADLGLGEGSAEAYTCDLSAEYVRINAEYTT